MIMVKCLKCGEILISNSIHDFQQCSCDNETFVDGGGVYYSRLGGKDMSLVKTLGNNDNEI